MEGGAWVLPASQLMCLLKTLSLGPERPLPLGSSCLRQSRTLKYCRSVCIAQAKPNPSSEFRCL